MSIRTLCPRCGTKLKAPDAAAGRALTCPKCGDAVPVPSTMSARPVASVATPVPSPVASPYPNRDGSDGLAPSRSGLPIMVTSYVTQHLMPDERLIAVTRIHAMALLAPSIVAVVGLVVGLVGIVTTIAANQRGQEPPLVFVVIGIPMAVIAGFKVLALLVERSTTEFSCTDRRILIKQGLLTTQLREMPLAKVEALVMQQGPFGKIFGFGTLVFKGSGGTRRRCKNIEAPFDFYKRVQEQVAIAQKQR